MGYFIERKEEMSEVEMNRLILIGNGFDLAHGLKTSFYDFINYCVFEMLNVISEKYKKRNIDNHFLVSNDIVDIKAINENAENIKNILDYVRDSIRFNDLEKGEESFIGKLEERFSYFNLDKKYAKYFTDRNYSEHFNQIYSDENFHKQFKSFYGEYGHTLNYLNGEIIKNKLFKFIFYNCKVDKNWGGIEHDFYQTLLNVEEFYKEENTQSKKIDKLNKEFKNIIDCFIYYMKTVVSKQKTEILSKIAKHLMQPVNDDELSTQLRDPTDQLPIVIRRHMFLNFNYTNTVEKYITKSPVNVEEKHDLMHVQIHGRLEDTASGIIFGYGDELDSSYKELEDKNDNRYLKYSKSLHYLYQDNYQKLLDFLEGDSYQVYIWGHSCATSDRVLLQTIFEHKNCVSIKPFYYQDKKGNDNFADLCANISRSFTDKKKFRDLVVNKEYCEPLT